MPKPHLASFMDLANGRVRPTNKPVLAEISAPSVQTTNRFAFQSYMDSTLLQNAVLLAAPNEPIIKSTAKRETIPGYAVGLHPSSECPVAIQFEIGGQPSSSSAITLVPGQILRPHGLPKGMDSGNFSGFTWGLPFGWLGGGVANLHVFQTPDADESWPGRPEIIFHRARYAIVSVAGAPAVTTPFNWPTRFPWVLGSNEQSIQQRNQPIIAVEPTKIELSLRLPALLAAATIRFVIQSSDAMDWDRLGAAILTGPRFVEHIFGTYGASGVAGNLANQFPVEEISSGPLLRFGCNNPTAGGVSLINSGGSAELVEAFVDITRYGKL